MCFSLQNQYFYKSIYIYIHIVCPEENKGNILKNHALGHRFCQRSLGKQGTIYAEMLFLQKVLKENRGQAHETYIFCNGPYEHRGNLLKIMVWENIFC